MPFVYLLMFVGGLAYLFRRPLKYIIPAIALLFVLINWPAAFALGVVIIAMTHWHLPPRQPRQPPPPSWPLLPPPEPRVDLFRK